MYVTVFRNRLRQDNREDYERMLGQMRKLAAGMPGFLSAKTFVAEDGERVTLVEFATPDAQHAWRDLPAHRLAQEAGRDRFYAEYRLQVCEVVRESRFPATSSSVTGE